MLLGYEGADHVLIRVRNPLQLGQTDDGDALWLDSPIEVVAGGLFGRAGAGLRANELKDFRIGLERLYESLKGEAILQSVEPWLSLEVQVTRTGGLVVTGELRDQPGSRNRLTFSLSGLDQSFLLPAIRGLREIERYFPVLDKT